MRAKQPSPVRDWRLSLRSSGSATCSSDSQSAQKKLNLPASSAVRGSEETVDAGQSLDQGRQISSHEAWDRLLAESLEIIRALEVENQFLKGQVVCHQRPPVVKLETLTLCQKQALDERCLRNCNRGAAGGDLQTTSHVTTNTPAFQIPLASSETYPAGSYASHQAMFGHLPATTQSCPSSLPVAQPNYRLCSPLYADRGADDGPTAQLLAEQDVAHTLARCMRPFDTRSLPKSVSCTLLAGVDGACHIPSASMQSYMNYHPPLTSDAHKTTPISGSTSQALSPTRSIAVYLSGKSFAPGRVNGGNREVHLTDLHPVPAGHPFSQEYLGDIGKVGKQLHETSALGHDTTQRTMSPAVEAPASSQDGESPFPAQRTEPEQPGFSSRFFGLFGPTTVDRPALSSHAVHMGISINDPLAHTKWKALKRKVTLWVILTEPTWASQRHVRHTTVLSIASYINATKEFTGIHTDDTRVRGLIGRLRKEWKRRALKKRIKNQQE